MIILYFFLKNIFLKLIYHLKIISMNPVLIFPFYDLFMQELFWFVYISVERIKNNLNKYQIRVKNWFNSIII